ncbi:MAG: YegS/Rv2252/BmrU family lipid kinase [Planctomycetes bacterium]|jgi:YegS/Rv2252/BmrU family lipid kinase|nr:diacylglycerol kinase family lipid kinase [Phycisphaerae bacterium]NBB95525.1 YegS/Rv2252/BmrU family lipid kinase [Planctomycetota bacterium]
MTDKPVYLIINPRSGYGGRKRQLANLRGELAKAGYDLVEYVTKYAGDATRYAREIAGQAEAVISFGGDGTVNEVANGLLGTDVPMLAAPAGTENLLAKELQIPSNPADLVKVLATGQAMRCDMGMINGRSFHSIVGVGFDAEVVRRVSAGRTGHISHLSYFWPIWRTFWEHNFPTLRVTADGRDVFQGRGLAFVGNISRYSIGLRICRDARFDDGLLDLVVFECDRQTGLILHAGWTMLRRHPLKGNCIYEEPERIHIETDQPLTCQVDGDVGPESPLEISVAEHRITLIVPQSRSRWTLPMWPWKGAPL